MEENHVLIAKNVPGKLVKCLAQLDEKSPVNTYSALKDTINKLTNESFYNEELNGVLVDSRLLHQAYVEAAYQANSNKDVSEVERTTLIQISNILSAQVSSLKSQVSSLHNTPRERDQVKGLLTQLETRQRELNQASKDRVGLIENTAIKHKNELERHAEKYLDYLIKEADRRGKKSTAEIEETLAPSGRIVVTVKN